MYPFYVLFLFKIILITLTDQESYSGGGRPSCNRTLEYLNSCGRVCERNCENAFVYDPECIDGFSGAARCQRPACHCKKNLVRHNGTCIRKDDCPRHSFKCPSKEVINPCGNLCELRCEDVMQGSNRRMCPNVCEPSACVCVPGYVRRGYACVPVERCRPWGDDGDQMGLDDDDDDGEPGVPVRGGDGYGEKSSMPRNCGINEYLNRCGSKCEPTCKRANPPCPRRCFPPACHCKEGYVRGPKNKCLLPKYCPEVFQCPRHEEVNPCGNRCELKCQHVVDGSHPVCADVPCGAPACACAEGFARASSNLTCIPYDNCYRRS